MQAADKKGYWGKKRTFENHSKENVSLATNVLDGWYTFHSKVGIHSYVCSTKSL